MPQAITSAYRSEPLDRTVSAHRRIVLFLFLWISVGSSHAQGITRVPNTTLTMPQSPSTHGFTTVNAFPGLLFFNAVCIASPPGETNRLFIVERSGRIQVITDLANPTKTLFLDISSRVNGGGDGGLLGLAFHPGYSTNRWFFVYYSLTTSTAQGSGSHDRLARFEAPSQDASQALVDSELPLLTQFRRSDIRHGGDIHFGTDGYLYVSAGDEDYADANSQRIDRNFFSGILRLDVDRRSGSMPPNPHPAASTNYAIPPDNPFVGISSFNGSAVNPDNIRTEFWAVGLRVPWRFSFDPLTGDLYCGDVGEDTREEVDLILKGGNYGWNYREGSIPHTGAPTPPAGVTFVEPILDYRRLGTSGDSTREGDSVIGGVVYRGGRFSQIFGEYIFGDYISGNIWALHVEGGTASNFRQLTTASNPSVFGIDPSNGDVLIAEYGSDKMLQLIYDENSTGGPLPPTLRDTGAFSDLTALTPNSGILPYDLNVPFWSDSARKTRWFSLPDTNLTLGFNPTGNWSFPSGAVWIKHFELEMTNGVPESARRLETRFIVRNAGGVYGVTYRWGDSKTNAVLVPEEGMDEAFQISDGGVVRTQIWHYPGRSECLRCHTPAAGHALGFKTAQLNRDFNYGGTVTNQIYALSQAGYFQTNVTDISSLVRMAHATNSAFSMEHRVRSYLDANCAQCHQPGGAGRGYWDARISTPMSQAGIMDGILNDTKGDTNNRVIRPGAIANSMMLTRISTLGAGRMPPLATSVLDTQSIALVSRWITNTLAGVKQDPIITWADPAPIMYGIPLGEVQLSATANVFGTFDYMPPPGTVLTAGNDQSLSVTFLPQDAEIYNAVSANVSIDVQRDLLTVTAEDKTKVYGQANPVLTARYEGFVNGDGVGSLDVPVSLSTAATAGSAVGVYPIVASGAADENYTITFVDGTLTVEANAQFNSIVLAEGGRLRITFTGLPGRTYRVEFSNNLIVWQSVADIQADENGAGIYHTATLFGKDESGFYRIAWP